MKFEHRLIQRAVSAFAVGVAFFLFSCQMKTVTEKRAEIEPARDFFALGESDFEAGRFDEAIQNYQLYLKRQPAGDNYVKALNRIADIHFHKHRYDEALAAYSSIVQEYPGYPEIPRIRYNIARIHSLAGEFEASNTACMEWLGLYPDNSLKGDIMFLLGSNYNSLGNSPAALFWWLKVAESPSWQNGAWYTHEEVDDGIIHLIENGQLEELKEMAQFASESVYLPPIYRRITAILWDENSLEEAKKYAMLLVRSTPEQYWVSIGREFLEKILQRMEEETEIRPGAIGCLLPLSGPFALYGEELLNGIQLGMGLFSQGGGDQGVELIIRDTRGNAENTVSLVEELVNKEKVMAIIGPLASVPAAAAAERAQELGVPIITFTQKEGITKIGDMVFRNFLKPSKEVDAILKRTMIEMGKRRFAIFYPDNPYGNFFMNLFWDRVEDMGGEITAVESYDENETDFAVEIKKMVGLYYPRPESVTQRLEEMEKPQDEDISQDNLETAEDKDMERDKEEEPEPIVDFEAVFIPDNHNQVALIAPQFPFYNVFNVPFLGTSLWYSDELLDTTGDYVQGAIFPSGFYADSNSEAVKEFVHSYERNFGSVPGVLAANGYDTIRFLKDLIAGGGIRSRRDFRSRLLDNHGFFGVTGKISFNQFGEVEKDPFLLTVHGNSLHLLN